MPAPSRSTRRAELSARKEQNKTQQTLLIAIIGIVAVFGILIVIALNKGGDEEPSVNSAVVAAATSGAPGTATAGSTAAPSSKPTDADPLRAKVTDLLRAIQEGDSEVIGRCISFPRWNDALVAAGKESKRWSEIDALTQTLTRQKITESLVADPDTREFMRQATIRSFVVMEQTDRRAKVLVIQQHLIDTKREQERTLELEKVDGTWFLASMVATAIQTPEQMQKVGETERAAEKAKRADRGLAPIEKQPLLADTPAAVQSQIDALCAKLTDTSATREVSKAKRELAGLGKPAIPALLNLIVGREELASSTDQIIVNHVVSVLKDITQEDLGYAPGGIGGTMEGDIKKENVKALMRWFGWWREHQKSWTGPRAEEEEK